MWTLSRRLQGQAIHGLGGGGEGVRADGSWMGPGGPQRIAPFTAMGGPKSTGKS